MEIRLRQSDRTCECDCRVRYIVDGAYYCNECHKFAGWVKGDGVKEMK